MKIILFNTYNKSNLSDFFVEFCKNLSKLGHQVTIVSLKKEHKIYTIDPSVEIKIFKKNKRYYRYFTLLNVVRKESPDVVISNFSYVNPVVLASKLFGVKHNIIWFHTLKSQMNFKPPTVYIKSKVMDLASGIITNSRELRQEVILDYKQNPEKVYNLPFTTFVNTVEIQDINLVKQKGKIYIGCPGRIHSDKNQAILIELLTKLNDDNIILVFAGSNQNDLLQKHPYYENYKHQIVYLGKLTQNEMIGFYDKMDVIILPSFNEAFGLVFIEALAMGCTTLVSSRFGSLDYITEDISAIVFDPNDVSDLKHKLKSTLANRKTQQYYMDLYRNNFSMVKIINQFISIIEKK